MAPLSEVLPAGPSLNVVAIGGGTGLSSLLRGLKHHVVLHDGKAELPGPTVDHLTAVVTVTDDGGSSGRLRNELGVPPPGDIRNCMTALSEDEALLSTLFQYRFSSGQGLEGHSFGNLFLSALADITGDFSEAVKLSSAILKTRGDIYPSTNTLVQLDAEMDDGSRVQGETNITASKHRIVHLFLVPPDAPPLPQTLKAISEADLITVGPGSLFTSLATNLLIPGIPEALVNSHALRVYICNLMTQANESLGLSASEHIQALFKHAGQKIFDYALIHDGRLPAGVRAKYAAQAATPIEVDEDRIRALGVEPIVGHYLDDSGLARHDSSRLASEILQLAARVGTPRKASAGGTIWVDA